MEAQQVIVIQIYAGLAQLVEHIIRKQMAECAKYQIELMLNSDHARRTHHE